MHKVFISYHHQNDQHYKNQLVDFGKQHSTFIDRSVTTGAISDDLNDQQIRRIIRDRHLRDSTVTIVLVGTETKYRKHVDWEIYSSMYNGSVNKRSGILVINLPSTSSSGVTAPHGEVEKRLYPEYFKWSSIHTRIEYERKYPFMPARIIDNLMFSESKISVVSWDLIDNVRLNSLIDLAFEDRSRCKFNLSRKMRRVNSSSRTF